MRRLQIHEESSTGTADDLNAFRRQVSSIFGGFSAREGAIINSFAYLHSIFKASRNRRERDLYIIQVFRVPRIPG